MAQSKPSKSRPKKTTQATRAKSFRTKPAKSDNRSKSVKATVPEPDRLDMQPERFARLHKWNIVLAGLHFIQAVAVLLLSTGRAFSVTTGFTAVDPLQTAAQGGTVLTIGYQHLFDINLTFLVAAFFLLSAVAHLSIATWYRRRYEAGLTQGINRLRWFEYALSASTMMVAIGLLVGMQDLSLLLLLFAGTAVMNLTGLIMETVNRTGGRTDWLSYWVGSLAGLFPWIAVAIYLFGSNVYGGSVPTFVYFIFVSIFIFFSCFAVNMVLQYKRVGKWSDYLYGERAYMILSLVAKSVLAWQVFAGALKP